MLSRIADLTWARPKTVLGLVGALVVLAGVFGRDLEDHLKAAGFVDEASESERATELLHQALGHDPNPGIVLVVRAPGGGRLDLRAPAVRAEIGRLTRAVAGAQHIG